MNLGTHTSERIDIYSSRGTLLVVLCFLCMINDLTAPCPTIKYVNDTSVYYVTNYLNDTTLQLAIDTAINWSIKNKMNINAIKERNF